ncbi:MAG: hypothetical protein M3150_02640, partial [Pseudomonadota bacterium]|nr:hypothetical protein [Pseudomonadota bacterium]
MRVVQDRLRLLDHRARLLYLGLDGPVELVAQLTGGSAEVANCHDLGQLGWPNTISASTRINKNSIGPMPRMFIAKNHAAIFSWARRSH